MIWHGSPDNGAGIPPLTPADSDRDEVRVEHRGPGGVRVLASGTIPLAPVAAWLEEAGQEGEVVVVDVATGKVRIRWQLRPRPDHANPAPDAEPPPSPPGQGE